MRVIFVHFFILFLTYSIVAQSKIDSLEAALKSEPTSQKRVDILNQLGFEYWIVNPAQSIFYGQKAKNLAEILQDSSELAFSCRVIGVAHWAKGSYDAALSYLQESLTVYRLLGDELGEANCLMNQGLVYDDRRDFHRALEQYVSALDIFRKLGKEDRVATTYAKMGTTFIELGNLTEASKYLVLSLDIHKENNFKYGVAETMNRLGLLFFNRGQMDSAVYYLGESKAISEEINDREGQVKYFEDIADVFLRQGKPVEAEQNLILGARLAVEIGSNKRLKEFYFDLKNIYERRGDLKKALEYSNKYVELSDSIFNEEIARNLIDFETQLATSEKERLISQQQQEIAILEQQARIDWLIRTSIGGLFIFSLISGYLIFSRQRLSLIRKRELAESRARELDRELEIKNREIASYTINFVQKNKVFEDLKALTTSIKTNQHTDPILKEKFKELDRTINSQLQTERDWEDFKIRFQALHKDFFDQLIERNQSLTNNELRLSALIKLNFSLKEIGNILGISSESVKTARYRLKKKLDLPSDLTLNDFFNNIEQ